VSGSGISCTSLQTDNHASTPPLKFFTGRMPFLLPNQQRQSTEGTFLNKKMVMCIKFRSSKLPFVRLETPASVIIGTLGMSPFIAVPEDYHTNIPHQN